jgi:hypothetical protein
VQELWSTDASPVLGPAPSALVRFGRAAAYPRVVPLALRCIATLKRRAFAPRSTIQFSKIRLRTLGRRPVVEHMGFEPTTSGLQSPRSPS